MERCVVRILLGGMSGTFVGLLCYYLMSVVCAQAEKS